MTRSRMIVFLLFVIAFGAGLSVGQLWQQRPLPPEPRGPSWLSAELSLDADQRQSLLKIWDGMNEQGYEEGRRRRELQRERSRAIRELIPQDSQARVDEIDQRYAQGMNELSDQRKQRFEDAMARTRAVLSPAQQEKYEEILQRRDRERRRPPGSRGEMPGRPRGQAGEMRERPGPRGQEASEAVQTPGMPEAAEATKTPAPVGE